MPKPLVVDWNFAQAMYVQGMGYAAIAEKVGVTQASLRQRAHRYGWKGLKTESVIQASQTVTRHNGKTLAQRSAEVRAMLGDEISGSVNALLELPIEANITHLNERAEVTSKLTSASGKVFGWSDEAESSMIIALDIRSFQPTSDAPVKQLEG